MSNTNPHDPIDAGYFYCPYVPLQTSSIAGNSIIELGLFYGETCYNNIHALLAAVIRIELKRMRHFVRDMLP